MMKHISAPLFHPYRLERLCWKRNLRHRVGTFVPRVLISQDSVGSPPTLEARQHAILGLVLASISIPSSIFPICGIPAAIAALVMGYTSCRHRILQGIVLWTMCLAVCGLLLASINIAIVLHIF